jgi:CheY-like chemotaxis protein
MCPRYSPEEHAPSPHSSPTPTKERITKRVQATIEFARDLLARVHQAFDHTRQLLKEKADILSYNQARRERKAELQASPTSPLPAAPLPPVEIVLIEECPADVQLVYEALKEWEPPCQISVLQDRSAIEDFVHYERAVTQAGHPQLILLDSQVPGMSAEEILATLRSLPAYKNIPTIIFSTNDEKEGQQLSIQCGATMFVQKPIDLQESLATIQALVRVWGRP